MFKKIFSVSVLGAMLLAAGCTGNVVANPVRSELVDLYWGSTLQPNASEVNYGPDNGCATGSDETCGGSQTLDIYNPILGGNKGVIVVIHGGGFVEGDKTTMMQVAGEFKRQLHRGYGIVSINYRMESGNKNLPNGAGVNGAPKTLQDIVAAMKWVKTNGSAYGLNTNKLVVYGFSAGGTLSTLAGTAANSTNPLFAGLPVVQGWVEQSGIVDWNAGLHSLFYGYQLMGTEYIPYHDSINPINLFDCSDPKGYLLHGDQDQLVEVANMDRFVNQAKAIGCDKNLTVDKIDLDSTGISLEGARSHISIGGMNAVSFDSWIDGLPTSPVTM